MPTTDSFHAQSLHSLLGIELPVTRPQETPTHQRIDLRNRLLVCVQVRDVTGDSLGPAREYPLRDLSAGGLSISSPDPIAVGSTLDVRGCINHRTWQGRLKVIHCTQADGQYKIGMQLIGQPEAATSPVSDRCVDPLIIQTPGRTTCEIDVDKGLTQVELDLAKVRAAFDAAQNTWTQMGRTVRRLILKAAHAMPGHESQTDLRRHSREPTSMDATMVLTSSEQCQRIAVRVTDTSPGGIGGEIAAEDLEDACALHAGLAVMLTFGTEADTIWLPAEIVRCQADRKNTIHLGIQFVTPKALQFFGA